MQVVTKSRIARTVVLALTGALFVLTVLGLIGTYENALLTNAVLMLTLLAVAVGLSAGWLPPRRRAGR